MAKRAISQEKPAISVIFDTDVVINWLIKEVETTTNRELWKVPHKIISFIENKKFNGKISLTTLLEIRYLLRRKKGYTQRQIEEVINDILSIFEIVIPDEISLLESNTLQSNHLLDPFDSILLGLCVISKPAVFISRDVKFLRIASKFLKALTPEKFAEEFL